MAGGSITKIPIIFHRSSDGILPHAIYARVFRQIQVTLNLV